MLRMVRYMLVCEARHEVVAVVVVGLQPEVDALVVARLLGRLDEVLRKQLLLLVEVVASALHSVSMLLTAGDGWASAPHR